MSFIVPAALLLLQKSALPTSPVVDTPRGFGYEPQLSFGERLLAYSWDGGARIPFLSRVDGLCLGYGERGAPAGTRLYLPANSFVEPEVTGGTTLASVGLVLGDGRFGSGLEFGPASFLRCALPPQGAAADGWTLSFWLRPESGAFGHTLVLMPGAVELFLQSDRKLRAQLLPSGERLTHGTALTAGEWTFVQLTYDALFLEELRLVVGPSPAVVSLAGGSPPRLASELQAGDVARNGQGFRGTLDELALDPHAASTADALQRQERGPRTGNHLLELYTNRGLRTAAPVAGATRQLVLDDANDFALGSLDGVVIENGELRWVPGRWTDLRPFGAPPPRTTHPLVALPGGRLFTFGGETRDTHVGPMSNTSDTWIYTGDTNAWERIPTALAPLPRCHVPAAYSPDHDLVLLVGGWRNDYVPGQTYSDTWVYHVGQRRWEQRFPGGDAFPFAFSDHSLVYLPELRRFLLLRGTQNWLYDPTADTWQRLPLASAFTPSGQPTSYGVGASNMHARDPLTGRVVLFGGSYGPTSTIFSDTTALYDVNSNSYTVLDPPVRPSARVRSGFAYDPRRDHFVLFGGVQDQFSLRHDDLWTFEPRTNLWHEVACSGRPSVRGGYYGMGYDEVGDRFLLFGGRSTPALWLDDTQALTLDEQRPGTALFTFDRLQGHGHKTWFARTTTPGSSAVSFAFRTSESGAEWSSWKVSGQSLGPARFVQVAAVLRAGASGEVPSIQALGLR